MGHQMMTQHHCAQVKRLHKLNNPNTPLPMSGNELADVIKNAATGALEVLQQSYSMPNFCEPPCPLSPLFIPRLQGPLPR